MKPSLLDFLACPRCEDVLVADHPGDEEIVTGELVCSGCKTVYPVIRGVPQLLDESSFAEAATSGLYSDIWHSYDPKRKQERRPQRGYDAPARSHLELLRLASRWELVDCNS